MSRERRERGGEGGKEGGREKYVDREKGVGERLEEEEEEQGRE